MIDLKIGFLPVLDRFRALRESCVSEWTLTIILPLCIPSRQILAYERGSNVATGKVQNNFQKSLFMYLKSVVNLNKLYFKAVGIPKQAAAGAFYGTW